MQAGDLMYCTFAQKGFATLISPHRFDAMFWNILWNGKVTLMHTDHLVAV